ncbi:MAG: hypothetical protein NVS2B12_05960 [Ktedonobacteraceae bacterium]
MLYVHLAPLGERVDDRDAHAVQAATDLVATTAELAASVQHGHHHFQRRHTRPLVVLVDRDAASIIFYSYRVVGVDHDLYQVRVASHGLVNTIIYNLIDEMMQPTLIGGTNIHTGAYTYGL